MRVICLSGVQGERSRLQARYTSLRSFKVWDEDYSLAQRLGFEDAEAAWEANPLVESSVVPSDFRTVPSWNRSGCRETVCYCHDEASAPRFCGHCGCRPEQAQVST